LRIEIDERLELALDEIKVKERTIASSNGHSDTVRFLANYYEQHKPIERLAESIKSFCGAFLFDLENQIEKGIERAIPKTAARVITNLLTADAQPPPKDAEQPPRPGDPAAAAPGTGR
jgi:hypothetical protein